MSEGVVVLAQGSQTSPWFSIVGNLIVAGAAFAGVAVTQRATRARDFDGRLWEARSKAYVRLMQWTIRLEETLIVDGIQSCPPRVDLEQIKIEEDLGAEVNAYGSIEILALLRDLKWALNRLIGWAGDERISAFPATRHGEHPAASTVTRLALGAGELRDVIRRELETGAQKVRSGNRILRRQPPHGSTGPVAQRARGEQSEERIARAEFEDNLRLRNSYKERHRYTGAAPDRKSGIRDSPTSATGYRGAVRQAPTQMLSTFCQRLTPCT